MPRSSPYRIELSAEEREHLEGISRKYTSPYCDVIRTKVVLLAARGLRNKELGNKEIGERLDVRRKIVSKWRKRFFEERLAGLRERPRRGRPRFFPR